MHREAVPVGRLGSILFVLGLALAACSPTPRAPDVVLVVVDTLRADHLPEYGHERPTSGALADFLASAHRFEACYAPASWTRPSVASIFSGMVPARHGAKGSVTQFPDAIEGLAEVLWSHGWQTAGFSHNVNISSKTGFAQGFDVFGSYDGGVLAYPDASEMTSAAVEWITSRSSKPSFIFMQPMNVHGPYRVPPEHSSALLGRPPSAGFVYQSRTFQALMKGELGLRQLMSPRILASLGEQYDTAILYTLDEIGRVFEALRVAGRFENSLIILTSDHGEELFDHGGFGHGYTLHQEIVRVPFFVKLPSSPQGGKRQTGRQSGRVIRQAVSLTDIYPTILDLVGLPTAASLDGVSLRPLLEGGELALSAERELLLEGQVEDRFVGQGIVVGRYKLLLVESDYQGRTGVVELFDLVADPAEHHDLAAKLPEVVADLRARLAKRYAAALEGAIETGDQPEVELDRKTLEALGYL